MMSKKRPTILIVDDSQLAIEIASEALADAGFEVLTAIDMAELERHLANASPSLILMDVQMPELFGDDVAMVLRAARDVTAPIYLFSSLDEEELKVRAAEAEVDGYICKKDGTDELVARVRCVIAESSSGSVGESQPNHDEGEGAD